MDSPMSDFTLVAGEPVPAVTEGQKRKSDDGVHDSEYEVKKLMERMRLSTAKPSYVLQLASKPLRAENRVRLRYLLCRLLKQHDWVEAIGVLSMYLKATIMDRSPARNHFKYSVLAEILKHTRDTHHNLSTMKSIFDIWMRKNGMMKSWPKEDRYRAYLEYIIFSLMQGNVEDAYQAAISLKQENEVGDDPLANLVLGIAFYELWYSNIPQEWQWRDSRECDHPGHSDIAETRFVNQVVHVNAYNTNQSYMSDTGYKCSSDTSVKNGRRISSGAGINQQIEVSSGGNVNHQIENSQSFLPLQNFYLNSDENEADGGAGNYNGGNMEFPFFLLTLGDDSSWLLPLRLPYQNDNVEEFENIYRHLFNDYYKEALKHLQHAVYSNPPVSAALLPWIQLMLIGGHVHEALADLEKLSSLLGTALPNRLRVALLESFDQNNFLLLISCLEDIMKKDPTCSGVLAKLVRMHHNGYYGPESLLEMISLHLEGTYGDLMTWREFASCFLKLSYSEEDQMSAFASGDRRKSSSKTSPPPVTIPTIFTEGNSGKTWRLRCRWWLNRHFSKPMLKSDTAAGDLELLTYKAACASHIYGPEFDYVVEACSHLKKDNDRDLLSALKLHMKHSVGIYSKIQ